MVVGMILTGRKMNLSTSYHKGEISEARGENTGLSYGTSTTY